MSRIDLEKRTEKVRIILEKRAIPNPPPMRVGATMDVSGSADWLYAKGIIQETVSRLMAVSMRFDDNGELDGWAFSQEFKRLGVATADNFQTYVKREILDNPKVKKWSNTYYAPVMADIVDAYFGKAKPTVSRGFFGNLMAGLKAGSAPQSSATTDTSLPALNMFVTDGACNDRDAAARVLRAAQKHPLYWLLVGVGDPKEFGFLQEMADELPNVGFVHLPSLEISDDALYEQLLSDELCTWLKKR